MENEILVTIDVSSLYTNIPPAEGIEEVRKFLQSRPDKSVPTELVLLWELSVPHPMQLFL